MVKAKAISAAKQPKLAKGKGKAVEKVSAKPAQPEVDDESEWSSEDEDEENGGVSEKGMRRLMELVGEEDLNEEELAQLGATGEDEEDDEEGGELGEEDGAEIEESDEEDDEDHDEDVEDEDGENDEDEVLDLPTGKLDNSVLIDEADPDAIAMDDIASNASLDEDAVPMRKITINNKPALRALTDAIRVTSRSWPEHLVLSSKEIVDVDTADDLQRETAFYKVALEQIPVAKKFCAKHDIPFSRPTDYYAEMVKSDEHMERVRTKLVEEASGIKKSEAAKKQRDLKKYGKQIQVEKLKQREMDKKSFNEKMQGVKRKRNEGMDIGGDDEFGIELDDDRDDERGGKGAKGAGAGGRDKPKMPRHVRDNKYSLGGGSRRSKQNTKESTNDFGGWGGGKGGKGASKGKEAGGSRRKGRPGKSRRAAGR